ncbi:F0F1 ATP synthase subunit delta [Methylocella silvestris]|uniref:ATP synthase subunit delta n=1 Tax=Methylocella silvestris TaxID=199596 RepID=A0A2J7TJE5_METSI|nr:F0F1 ATP synthase subunit delta [Methylocella silvestris]PNG26885.1 F0F1 ATP synthase subunit delta [Methylocella silvestris]
MAKQETLVSGMAGRYAQALFALAQERGATEGVANDLATFASMLDESEDLRNFVRSPVFSAEQQSQALNALLERAGLGGTTTSQFLNLVAAKRRLFAVADMIRDFNVLHDHAVGLSRAAVTVAEPLKDEHVAALKDALAAVAGSQRVEMSVKVDPSIIGGIIVQLGSRMVDNSLKTKLNSIRARMKEVG